MAVIGDDLAGKEIVIEGARGRAGHDGSTSRDPSSIGQLDSGGPSPLGGGGGVDARHVGAGDHRPAVAFDDRDKGSHEGDPAAHGHRHPAHGHCRPDDLGDEGTARVVGTETVVQGPRCEGGAGHLAREGSLEPGGRRLEHLRAGREEALSAETAEGGPSQGCRLRSPEVSAEQAEGQIDASAEVGEHGLPRRTVTETLELGARHLGFGGDDERAVRGGDAGRPGGVGVDEAVRRQVVLESSVCRAADEEGVPRGERLDGVALEHVAAGPDRPAGLVVAFADHDLPAGAREQGGGDETVDPAPDDDGVGLIHGASLACPTSWRKDCERH